jgi:hypothetical protein
MTRAGSSTDDRGGRIEGATFAPVRVAAGGRPPVLVGALIAGMLAIAVAVAAMGRDASNVPTVVSKPETEAPAVVSAAPVSVAAGSTFPDPFAVAIVTMGNRITVTGTLGIHANLVTVTLETASGMTADWTLLGIANPDGEIRLDETPPFSARFNLAKAVADVPLWVQVDAYTDTGARVASTIQPVVRIGEAIGPLGSRVH